MLSLLVGSIAIALIAVAHRRTDLLGHGPDDQRIRAAPAQARATGVIDMLATVPEHRVRLLGAAAGLESAGGAGSVARDPRQLRSDLSDPEPGQYVKSIFACGLICAVTIIPIITSISREVMAQAPRDVCEAALGLGGTRWGMVTDVILPFSRNGILGAVLLGIGRGLGETMIVVLVLSQGNHLTSALMGPGGLGSIAAEITENFVASSAITKSGLILLGLVLFMTTLAINIVARLVVERSNKALAVTQTLEPPTVAAPPAERPTRSAAAHACRSRVPRSSKWSGSAVAAIALVWLCFTVGGIAGPLGFAFCAVSGLPDHLRDHLLAAVRRVWP